MAEESQALRSCLGGKPEGEDGRPCLAIELTESQELTLLRQMAGKYEVRYWLLGQLEEVQRLRAAAGAVWRDRRAEGNPALSQSLLRGFGVFTELWPPGTERGISDLAGVLNLSPNTTRRYTETLVELGLVEWIASSCKYRLSTDEQEYRAGN